MNGGDGEGYEPHPGDPWHPGWGDDTDDETVEPTKPLEGEDREGFFKRLLGGTDVDESEESDEGSTDHLFDPIRTEEDGDRRSVEHVYDTLRPDDGSAATTVPMDELAIDEGAGDEIEHDEPSTQAATGHPTEVLPPEPVPAEEPPSGPVPETDVTSASPESDRVPEFPPVLSDVSFDASSAGSEAALWAIEGTGHSSDAAMEHQDLLAEFAAAEERDAITSETATAEQAIAETVIDVSAEEAASDETDLEAAVAATEAAALTEQFSAAKRGADDVLSEDAASAAAAHEERLADSEVDAIDMFSQYQDTRRAVQAESAMADHAGEAASAHLEAEADALKATTADQIERELARARAEATGADMDTTVGRVSQLEAATGAAAAAAEREALGAELATAAASGAVMREHEAVRLGTDDAATSFSVPDVDTTGFEFDAPEPHNEAAVDAQTTGPISPRGDTEPADESEEPEPDGVDETDSDGPTSDEGEEPKKRGWRRWLGIGATASVAAEETAEPTGQALASAGMADHRPGDDETSELPLSEGDEVEPDEPHPVPTDDDVGFEGWLDDPKDTPQAKSAADDADGPYVALNDDDPEEEIADWMAFTSGQVEEATTAQDAPDGADEDAVDHDDDLASEDDDEPHPPDEAPADEAPVDEEDEEDTDEFPVPVPIVGEGLDDEDEDQTAEVVAAAAAVGTVHAVVDLTGKDGTTEDQDEESEGDPSPGDDVFDELTKEEYLQGATSDHADLAAVVAVASQEDTEQVALAASMPGLDSGVVGFDDVVEAEGQYAATAGAPRASNLLLRVGSAILLIVVFLLSLLWQPALIALAMAVFVVAAGEFYTVLMQKGYKPLALFGFLGIVGASLGTVFWDIVAIPVAWMLTALVILVFFAVVPGRPKPLVSFSVTITVAVWVGFGAYAFPIIESDQYRALVLAVVAGVALMDIASYFVGRYLGRNQLAPVVSPKKTWEGLVGGVLVVLLFGAVLGYLEIEPFDLTSGLYLGAVIAVVGPLGDLAVSVVKRSIGVKDMGALLPGHGGILDRIDALLFVIPAAWAMYIWLGLL